MADIADGESVEMQGSGVKPYVLKNVGGVYSCSCPAWRNQSVPIESRTCKHLRKLRGDDAEKLRVGGTLPAKAKPSAAKPDAPPVLLAQTWDNATDLTGWWISEKLDGVRAYWDGKRFLSRLGNTYHAPDWFVDGLPDDPLDGELWIDRQAFQRTVSIVRRQDKSEHWKEVKFVVFDAPEHGGGFEDRIQHLQQLVRDAPLKHLLALEQQLCTGNAHLKKELARVEELGGEGLMLRQPLSKYVAGRSGTLLKVKTFHDTEAIVVSHAAGKGKHKGRMGALNVQLPDGTDFSVGTGFSDKQREQPPAIGSIITFRYQELSNAGVPRFPSFVRAVAGEKADEIRKQFDTAANASLKENVSTKETASAPETKSAASRTTESDKGANQSTRYFEFVDAKSSKFWELTVNDAEVTVRYGRIGTAGTTKPKTLDTAAAADALAEKLIQQKTAKGYEER